MQDFTIRGECKDCGRCCSNILFSTKEEINRIKKYMKENNIVLKTPYSIFNKEYKPACPFLDENKKCIIYPVRLKICSTFSCNKELHEEMSYKDTEIIDMLETFGENLYYPCKPDLQQLNNTWKAKVKKAYD